MSFTIRCDECGSNNISFIVDDDEFESLLIIQCEECDNIEEYNQADIY